MPKLRLIATRTRKDTRLRLQAHLQTIERVYFQSILISNQISLIIYALWVNWSITRAVVQERQLPLLSAKPEVLFWDGSLLE